MKHKSATNDEYAAFALVESLRQNETKTDFFDKTLKIKPAPITGTEAANYDKLRTFIVNRDLSAVYRFESDGNGVMIYNIDGTKG